MLQYLFRSLLTGEAGSLVCRGWRICQKTYGRPHPSGKAQSPGPVRPDKPGSRRTCSGPVLPLQTCINPETTTTRECTCKKTVIQDVIGLTSGLIVARIIKVCRPCKNRTDLLRHSDMAIARYLGMAAVSGRLGGPHHAGRRRHRFRRPHRLKRSGGASRESLRS